MMASLMQMMNSAMDKRDEKFMKMLEDRDASHQRHETIAENALNGSGGAGNVVGTEKHVIVEERRR